MSDTNDDDDSDVEEIADQEVHPTSKCSFDDVTMKKSESVHVFSDDQVELLKKKDIKWCVDKDNVAWMNIEYPENVEDNSGINEPPLSSVYDTASPDSCSSNDITDTSVVQPITDTSTLSEVLASTRMALSAVMEYLTIPRNSKRGKKASWCCKSFYFQSLEMMMEKEKKTKEEEEAKERHKRERKEKILQREGEKERKAREREAKQLEQDAR